MSPSRFGERVLTEGEDAYTDVVRHMLSQSQLASDMAPEPLVAELAHSYKNVAFATIVRAAKTSLVAIIAARVLGRPADWLLALIHRLAYYGVPIIALPTVLSAQVTQSALEECMGATPLAVRQAQCKERFTRSSDATSVVAWVDGLIAAGYLVEALDELQRVTGDLSIHRAALHRLFAERLLALRPAYPQLRPRIDLILKRQAARLHYSNQTALSERLPVLCALYEGLVSLDGTAACKRAADGDSSGFVHMRTDAGAAATGQIRRLSVADESVAGMDTVGLRVVSSGSGFYVTRDGHFITSAHVVAECSAASVRTLSGKRLMAKVATADVNHDLALLEISGEQVGVIAAIRTVPSVRLGENVVTAGFPLHGFLADQLNVTTGTVSALAGIGDNAVLMQITAPVQPGNSGGPVFDANGNVIGVVKSKLNALRAAAITGDIAQNVNFAIKSSTLRSFILSRDLKLPGSANTARLEAADIGDIGVGITRLVECWR